jgi:hypothetical protein
MDDADSVPTIKLQSAIRSLKFIVLTADRCKGVVIHIPGELIYSFCAITYTTVRVASERQNKNFHLNNRHPKISLYLNRSRCNLHMPKLANCPYTHFYKQDYMKK